jgi:uncharacterized protein YukE
MPQAIVDPEELRRFAQNLRRFTADVQERLTTLNAQLAGLSKSWRDQEHQKFAEAFEQQMRSLSAFVEVAEEHLPYLLRKAEIIEEYLQQR